MRIRICSKCGKHNLETAWSCANCGESLSVYTITELDDELVELVAEVTDDDVPRQKTVSIRSRPEPEKSWESVKRWNLSDTWAVQKGIEYRRRHGFFTALLIFYFISSILSIILTISVMPIASLLGVVQLAAVVAIWYWKRWGVYVYYTLAVVGFVSNVLVGLPTFLWIIWLVSFGLFVFFSANQWNDFE